MLTLLTLRLGHKVKICALGLDLEAQELTTVTNEPPNQRTIQPLDHKFVPNFAVLDRHFGGRGPKFLTQFYKLESPSNTCQNLVAFDRATSEIIGAEKRKKKKSTTSAKQESLGSSA